MSDLVSLPASPIHLHFDALKTNLDHTIFNCYNDRFMCVCVRDLGTDTAAAGPVKSFFKERKEADLWAQA